ncbi:HNH endonuclease domain-containing protein [Bacillus cereus]|uniref:HNH endonuclease domain-containing protein n=1 Tax=Bacillus cereus TaxID=1396 RepID=A0AAW7NES7_BACCE|nr:HNH endonuclease domain-containing protein [Bacillus cereus]MCJ0846277.1 HNH nuclease [Bacillus cereus]MDA2046920.1 HNH nuclease [Bacillus cereus]MDN4873429.1 HNH endonuclease domain-containing protein [Bacillus cereus]
MIKIEIDDYIKELIEKEHFQDIEKRIKSSIEEVHTISSYKNLHDYFFDKFGDIDEKKLKKLIIGNKTDLIEIIENIGEIPFKKNDPFEKMYTNFTKRGWSKLLLKNLNVRVCPYCNRQYTFTLANSGIRPQFDHFFPKSLFSYLSVSLYNLIPSCSICNSKKHALNTYKDDLYYPYEDEFGNDVIFQTIPINNDFLYWTGTSNNFDIKVISKDEKQNNKVENLNKYMKIELLYKEHKDYIRDIIRNAVIYNDSRIDELLDLFPDLFQSKDEVINSIFMSNIDKGRWDKRPLSKLTHDIYEEFKIFSSNK